MDEPRLVQETLQRRGWKGLYFGGVAFKTQRGHSLDEAAAAANIARDYMDVVTTSGPATGTPPNLDKVKVMRDALGTYPLALASGLDLHNLDGFLPHVDAFLVATGLSRNFFNLDRDLVARFVEKVRAF